VPVTRWEDRFPRWDETDRLGEPLGYHPGVQRGPVAVGLWAAPTVRPSEPGGSARDLIVSSWDACFGGGVYRFPGLTDDLDVQGPGARIAAWFGNLDAVPENTASPMVGVARDVPDILLFPDTQRARPCSLGVRISWVRGPEILHVARACDIDEDGLWDLLIGTDDWTDYWPDGREWNDPAYEPYDAGRRWRGGPLRGHVYAARNTGTAARPRFETAVPLMCEGRPLEVYGAAAPAWADFLARGRADLICGDFLDRLWFFRHRGRLEFDHGVPVRGPDGRPLALPQNIHVPVAVRSDTAAPALLIGAEDGFVHRARPLPGSHSVPSYRTPEPVCQPSPPLHPGIEPVPSVCDWTGGGRKDLVIGTGGGWLLWFPDLGADDEVRRYGEAVTLRTASAPIRVQAGLGGSIQGPSEAKWGYLSPVAVDWDGDGRVEVLASDVMGRHLLFARTGDDRVLAAPRELRYRGTPLRTVWRVRPAVTAWGDPNGYRRYVCLDVAGQLVDFAKAGDDVLDDQRVLRYTTGAPIEFTEDRGGGLGRVKLAVCDWTGSGLGDLLVGTHARAALPPGPGGAPRHTHGQATVLLLENLGAPGSPRFGAPRQLRYRGRPLRFGMHSCAPAPVDWCGRDAPDLLVGVEDGTLLLLSRDRLAW
jgi:hypothetical protein